MDDGLLTFIFELDVWVCRSFSPRVQSLFDAAFRVFDFPVKFSLSVAVQAGLYTVGGLSKAPCLDRTR